jgi:outer membrane protein assembly factor BamB
MHRILLLTLVIAASGCIRTLRAQEVFISPKLEKVWEVSEGLDVPESAHYNTFDKTIYVSNIVGRHDVKDGIGYISKLSATGKMLEKDWYIGLNAPKGICCSASKLYVTDIDRVVEIDVKTGKTVKEYRNTKSKSLNDVSIAANGRVFISDSEGNCIFYVGNDSLEIFLESDKLHGMNGILAKNGKLYLGSNGNLISVDQKTAEIQILLTNVGYLDGLEEIGKDKFVSSDWKGMVFMVNTTTGAEKIIDTTPVKVNAADVGYIASQKMLLVPTFTNNKVVAYRFK